MVTPSSINDLFNPVWSGYCWTLLTGRIFLSNMPLVLHLDGLPEVITQIIGFSFLVPLWEFKKSKWVNIGIVAAFVLIVFMLSMGVYVNM